MEQQYRQTLYLTRYLVNQRPHKNLSNKDFSNVCLVAKRRSHKNKIRSKKSFQFLNKTWMKMMR